MIDCLEATQIGINNEGSKTFYVNKETWVCEPRRMTGKERLGSNDHAYEGTRSFSEPVLGPVFKTGQLAAKNR